MRSPRRFPPALPSGTSSGAICAVPPKPAICPRNGFGPSQRAAAVLRRFLRSPPRTWFWCYSSLATKVAHQKKSPGVLALSPGATLHFPVDTRLRAGASSSVAAASAAGGAGDFVRVSIEHLTSYENMGIASVRCVGGCSCVTQRVNAHRTDAHRNVSVFLQVSRAGRRRKERRACGSAQAAILPPCPALLRPAPSCRLAALLLC